VTLSVEKMWPRHSVAAIPAAPAALFTAAGESTTATATSVITELVAETVTTLALLRSGTGLADCQLAATEVAAVESIDRGPGFVIGRHFDKSNQPYRGLRMFSE
jgi:hypothetical protein